MKQFKFNGKSVSMGDKIEIPMQLGKLTIKSVHVVSPDSIPMLVEAGILSPEFHSTIDAIMIIRRVAKRLNCNEDGAVEFLVALRQVSEVTLYRFLLRECANILNRRRKVSICNLPKAYFINSSDGKIREMTGPFTPSVCKITTLFADRDDAEEAVNLLNGFDGLHNKMYSINEQKNQ